MYFVFSGACRNSIHWLFSPSQPFRFYTFMNWGWVVSASTLRWWLLKTLPIAWKLLSATKTTPDLYHQALKCLSMVSTHDHQGDLKASLAGGVCNTNNVFANRLYCIRLCHPNKIYLLREGWRYQIGWIFGKIPNLPPPLIFRKLYCNFFRKTSKKSPL